MIQTIGLICAIVLPLWNIPLILRMFQRKSSEDVSMSWAIGVWVCFVLMAPSGFKSPDLVWRIFNMMNLILFSCVVITVVYFRIRDSRINRNEKKD